MRVAILTSGRFWACDLARELDALGHDVAFYSYVPRSRTRRFGLPDRCNHCLLPWVAPWLAGQRLLDGIGSSRSTDHLVLKTLDAAAARLLQPCDVFIGWSGLAVRSAEVARRKFGARIWIERGSRHILSQRDILAAIPGAREGRAAVPDYAVERELAGYALADTIVVPSRQVEESFLERQVPPDKLFRNPFGVSLEMFPPTSSPPPAPKVILMVGAWSLRKGCDVLVQAWRGLPDVRLVHVGPVVDAPLPNDAGFEHHDAVDQFRLTEFYARAHVFALASREEGLALVQAQALASGLPVVCTTRTGGADLRQLISDPSLVTAVEPDDPDALRRALRAALERPQSGGAMRDALGAARDTLSWKAYGERYSKALHHRRQGSLLSSARFFP